MAKLVSKVYGDALFSAVEENRVDELWDETRAMKQVLSENPDFMTILEHPEMTMEKKMDVLQEVFQKELSQDMMGLLHVLVKKGRIGELIPVLAYFNECAMAYKKIGKVQIQTPMPLSEKQKKKIEQNQEGCCRCNSLLLKVITLSVDYEIDKSLLGGIVIRIGNQVLDNSIRAKLDAMTRDLSKVRLSN